MSNFEPQQSETGASMESRKSGSYPTYVDPKCPKCSVTLRLKTETESVTWECVQGHGELVNVATLYTEAQIDEIEALWSGARTATTGNRACPICDKQMTQPTFGVDDDELVGNNETYCETTLTLDVCTDCNAVWFDHGEREQLPRPHEHKLFRRVFERFGARF